MHFINYLHGNYLLLDSPANAFDKERMHNVTDTYCPLTVYPVSTSITRPMSAERPASSSLTFGISDDDI